MAPFRVIIVGGGITGLALANMLEQYDIDFAILEKHENLAPQLGAGYAMLPHGARILDQLGCYEVLEKLSVPVNSVAGYDDTGKRCTHLPDLGAWMEESLGYKMAFLERRQVLKVLYDNLRDKSKIYSPCKALEIRLTDTGVRVETDGEVFEGDIVVGADGVHSHVRREMERLAVAGGNEELFRKEDDFECSYRAIFGLSEAAQGVENEAFKGYRTGRSYLCSPGKGGILYWIALFKNDKETQGKANPQYTTEDRDKLAARYENDIIKPGVTLGDLYQKAKATALVPLEQGVLSTCFYKRVVLVGDSWHKVNPLSGQGGNTAIASAAYLTDGLKDLIDRENVPSQASIEEVFRNYQQVRGPISRALAKDAHATQRREALETPFLKFFQLKLARFLSLRLVGFRVVQFFNAGLPLKHMPPPSRHGSVPIRREVETTAPERLRSVKLWIMLLVPIFLGYYFFRQRASTII